MAVPINKAYSPKRVVGSGPAMSPKTPAPAPIFKGDPGIAKTFTGPSQDPGIVKSYPKDQSFKGDPGIVYKGQKIAPAPKPKRIG